MSHGCANAVWCKEHYISVNRNITCESASQKLTIGAAFCPKDAAQSRITQKTPQSAVRSPSTADFTTLAGKTWTMVSINVLGWFSANLPSDFVSAASETSYARFRKINHPQSNEQSNRRHNLKIDEAP